MIRKIKSLYRIWILTPKKGMLNFINKMNFPLKNIGLMLATFVKRCLIHILWKYEIINVTLVDICVKNEFQICVSIFSVSLVQLPGAAVTCAVTVGRRCLRTQELLRMLLRTGDMTVDTLGETTDRMYKCCEGWFLPIFCCSYILVRLLRIFKILVCTPHKYRVIMGGRHKNFKVLMQYDLVIRKIKSC